MFHSFAKKFKMNFSETIANDTDGWTSSNKFDNSRRIRCKFLFTLNEDKLLINYFQWNLFYSLF